MYFLLKGRIKNEEEYETFGIFTSIDEMEKAKADYLKNSLVEREWTCDSFKNLNVLY